MKPYKNSGFALVNANDEKLPVEQRIELQTKEIPSLKPGQVLVKVLAASVNPSDLVYLMGKYGIPANPGAFAGFEACGIVVDANAGLYGKWLQGKRVAVFATPGQDGVWANHVVTRVDYCVALRKELSDAQGATMMVNPCTAVCLVERAMELGAKAIIVNAAASQVGKGVIRYCKTKGIKTIATVRSESNLRVVQDVGATHVLLTSDGQFSTQLAKLASYENATVLLDAVADNETPQLLKQMPNGSSAIVYGRLTETHDPFGGYFSVADVIFRDMHIEGFWLSTYIKKAGMLRTVRLMRKVQKLFAEGIFDTDIYGEFDFSTFLPALAHYANHKSDGKVILKPN